MSSKDYVNAFWWPDQRRQSMGLTLRDHFAGLAMQGILAGEGLVNMPDGIAAVGELAHDAYAVADAMLKARGEP